MLVIKNIHPELSLLTCYIEKQYNNIRCINGIILNR